ncbi:hypothetical protein MKOR_09270 [Mycolicibacillus koreensis]|nr:hypothetical protein MKOR_09270 [Mycolicibacillus koreensis]
MALAAKIRSKPQDSPWVVMIESSTVVSEQYTNAAVCSTGSSGIGPSALTHTRLYSSRSPLSRITQAGSLV